MRQYINIVENFLVDDQKKPYISAHMSGKDTVWIDMMYIPPEKRGQGFGRNFYENWESNLPKTVKLVKLMAADTGDGISNMFWEKMGFEYQYYGMDLPYEVSQYMWKGVNGHPTPPAVKVD